MKNVKNLLLSYALVLISILCIQSELSAQDAGWRDSSYFKIQTAKVENQKYFKISNDGQSYFTLSDSNRLTKWNMQTGKKEYEKNLKLPENFRGFTISNLDEHYCYAHKAGNNYDTSYYEVFIYKLADTSLVKKLETNSKIAPQSHITFISDIVIYIDDKLDSVYTSTHFLLFSYFSGVNESWSLNSFAKSNLMNNFESIPITSISDDLNQIKKVFYTFTSSGEENQIETNNSKIVVYDNALKSYNQILYNFYHYAEGDYDNSGTNFEFLNFTFNTNSSKLAFIGRAKNDTLFTYDFGKQDTVKQFAMQYQSNGLVFVDNNLLVSSRIDYNNDSAVIYLLNSVDGQFIDSIAVRINELGKLSAIPNSNKVFIESNDGYYRILDIMSNVISGKINFTCAKPIQLLQDTFQFHSIEYSKFDSLLWDFGDGRYSKDNNPKHKYEKNGFYNVKLKAYLNGVNYIAEKKAYAKVIIHPKSKIDSIRPEGKIPFKAYIENKTTGDYEYSEWFVDNILVSNKKNFDSIFTVPGTYSIKLVTAMGTYSDTLNRYCYVNALTEAPSIKGSEYENEANFTNKNYGSQKINLFTQYANIDSNKSIFWLNNKILLINNNRSFISDKLDTNNGYESILPFKNGYFIKNNLYTPALNEPLPVFNIYDNEWNSIFADTLPQNNRILANLSLADRDLLIFQNEKNTYIKEMKNFQYTLNSLDLDFYSSNYDLYNPLQISATNKFYFVGYTVGSIGIAEIDKDLKSQKSKSILYNFNDNTPFKVKIVTADKNSFKLIVIQNQHTFFLNIDFEDNKTAQNLGLNYFLADAAVVDDRIILVGSKNNNPIMTIVDTSGTIITEMILTDRTGNFGGISKTYDGGFMIYGRSYLGLETYGSINKAFFTKLSKEFYTKISGLEDALVTIDKTAQLFPNPSNGISNLKIFTKANSSINVSIYDISGKKISDLFNGVAAAEQLNIMFDASKHLQAKGAYFVKIEQNGQTETVEMIFE